MASFDYETLRDGTVPTLLTKFGKSSFLRRKANREFNPDQGKFVTADATKPPYVDYPITILRIGAVAVLRGTGEYRDGMVLKWNEGLLVSADGLATEGIEPEPTDTVLYNGVEAPIIKIVPIAPGDVPVAFKFGIAVK